MFTVLDGVQQYFFYLYNAQGDVIAIIDDYAERVVNYEYSAWGELLSVTGSKADTIGTLNPFATAAIATIPKQGCTIYPAAITILRLVGG